MFRPIVEPKIYNAFGVEVSGSEVTFLRNGMFVMPSFDILVLFMNETRRYSATIDCISTK